MSKQSKLITCKHCGAEIASNAKVCPKCGGKNKKPIYKKWWFWLIIVLFIIGAVSEGKMESNSEFSVENTSTPTISSEAENETPPDTAKTEEISEEESVSEENDEKENADLPASSTASEETTKSEKNNNLSTFSPSVSEEKEPSESTNKDTENGISPEFKNAMDSYEAFFDEYIAFMEKYSSSDNSDLSLLTDYADYMSKYTEVMEDFEAWDSKDMSTEETAYYIEVQTRINQKLLKIAE